ncbi:hypothetical protein [Clostridium beijerinckii]|nr:hypothetical protein [Clostridium beijerinckii]
MSTTKVLAPSIRTHTKAASTLAITIAAAIAINVKTPKLISTI